MFESILFIIVVAIVYWRFFHKGKTMAPMMGELVKRGIDIDAQIVRKHRVQMHISNFHYYLVYSFTLDNNQRFSKEISPSFEQWESMEEGDTLLVVYLAEDPNISTTKEVVEQIRAAMHQGS